MCHFHQIKIVKRYITQNPKLEASIELKKIIGRLKLTNEKNFTKLLRDWHEKYKDLNIQNTTNSIEGGVFSHMKSMVSLHRGLTKSMKLTLVDHYLLSLGKK